MLPLQLKVLNISYLPTFYLRTRHENLPSTCNTRLKSLHPNHLRFVTLLDPDDNSYSSTACFIYVTISTIAVLLNPAALSLNNWGAGAVPALDLLEERLFGGKEREVVDSPSFQCILVINCLTQESGIEERGGEIEGGI